MTAAPSWRAALRRRTRPARHALAFFAVRLLVFGLRRLPLRLSLASGAGLGRLIGVFAFGERRRLRARLKVLAAPPSAGDCFADLGRRFAEFACARRLRDRVVLAEGAAEVYAAARAAGRGVLLATVHFGNWELMAAGLAVQGFAVNAIAARPRAGPLHRWLAAERAALGVQTLAPDGGARAAARCLGAGEAVAMFIDQATGERGLALPFLGRPAPTPRTFERLQAMTAAAPLLIWSQREANGDHRVHVEPLPADNALAAATARLEALVRATPTAWVWLHDRWRDG